MEGSTDPDATPSSGGGGGGHSVTMESYSPSNFFPLFSSSRTSRATSRIGGITADIISSHSGGGRRTSISSYNEYEGDKWQSSPSSH